MVFVRVCVCVCVYCCDGSDCQCVCHSRCVSGFERVCECDCGCFGCVFWLVVCVRLRACVSVCCFRLEPMLDCVCV